jgi:hypothetical protein
VPELSLSQVRMFPNPASGRVTIQSGSNLSNLAILDITGKTIRNISGLHSREEEIDISGLNNGLYLLRITTAQGVKVLRLQVLKQ